MKTISTITALGCALIWTVPLPSEPDRAFPPGTAEAVRAPAPAPGPPDTLDLSGRSSRTRGSDTAPITVYELSDFQCSFCRRFALETFPELEERYVRSGKVRWVFLNRPKPSKHANAVRAAEYAACAGKQGAFWSMHDEIFASQERWAPLDDPTPVLDALVAEADLDATPLLECVASGETLREIEADSRYAAEWGVEGVPAFRIGSTMVVGARPARHFMAVIDSVLAAQSPACEGPAPSQEAAAACTR